MRRIYFLMLPALALLFCACGNKGGNGPANSQQRLIVGKWSLQRQNVTVYVDGVKQLEVTKEASNNDLNFVRFDSNGNYTSVNYYNSGGLGSTSLGNLISVDTVRGTYNFSGAVFSLNSPALAGFGDGIVFGTSGSVEIIHLLSQSEQIMQLTSTVLTLHIEYSTTHTTDSSTKNYKNVLDYYYIK